MKSLRILRYAIVLFAFVLVMIPAESRDKDQKSTDRLGKVNAINPAQTLININNLTCWVTGTGFHDWIIASSYNGTFPKGTAGFIFAEGILWGGQVSDGQVQVVRVNGNTYSSGTRAGKILTDAAGNVTGREPDDPVSNRPYRVRPDYKTADLTDDAANFYQVTLDKVTDAHRSAIREQYEVDWNNWPWQKGAPFKDNNNNNTYEPEVDIPGIPGADQTIWIVYNDLDGGRTASTYGSLPIGLEVQETYWAYAATNPLGNVVFKKVKLIYKGTTITPAIARIDSMYIVQWADPDLGQYTDDFSGCDTTLSLGYVYNSSSIDAVYFNDYGLPPPAGGYDFLQGAIVPGLPTDSALFDFQWRKGFKNLPMTVFTFFAAGSARSDPDRGGPYDGTLQWYNLMTGFEPRPKYPERVPLRDHLGNITKFELTGDPTTGTGDLDGKPTTANPSRFPPGDRRIVLSTGPFTMMLRDTQEVVIALVGGIGADYLSSVKVLKFNDKFAQFAYNNLFVLPSPPPSPVVKIGEFDKQIVLNWGEDVNQIKEIEETVRKGFAFEGYNVYQLPKSTSRIDEAVKIATYDVVNDITVILDETIDEKSGVLIQKPVQIGKNSGICRFINIKNDAVRNRPLVNGQTYYFAITAYSYNGAPEAPFRALESSPVVLSIVPQSPKPGIRYYGKCGDSLTVTHKGISDGKVEALVIDPSRLTGDQYRVVFDTLAGESVWHVVNVTKNKQVLSNQTNQTGDDSYIIIDGVLIKVMGPEPGVKDWDIPSGTRRFTWAGGADGFHFEGFEGALGWASPHQVFGGGPPGVPAPLIKNVLLKLATVDVNGNYDLNDPNVSYGYRYGRGFAGAPARPEFLPFMINRVGGYSYQDFTKSVPLSAWDVESDPPRRLVVGHLENNVAGGMVDGKYWPPDYNVGNNVAPSGPREWLWIYDATYSGTPNPTFQVEATGNPMPIMYWATWARRGNVPFVTGDELLILANHVNSQVDTFSFSTKGFTFDASTAQADVEKINVFPNPYYGFNIMESTRLEKYVTFNHLPRKATIRIFNIAGVLVRVLDKDDASQFAKWDVRNDNNLPVASGIYIVHVDMPDIGKSKILKLALIQEEQVLKVY
ncbi:MAG: T9SS type A sorting domain-containing protein [Bacteroidota bacterium]|nr:T9SS type A sorting domain-containing protein [Bacteroidota bacterium]